MVKLIAMANKHIMFIAALLGSGALILAIVQNLLNINKMFYQDYWYLLIFGWILWMIALWPKSAKSRTDGFNVSSNNIFSIKEETIALYAKILLIILVFTIVACWRFWEQRCVVEDNNPIISPAKPIGLIDKILSYDYQTKAYAQNNLPLSSDMPIVLEFGLRKNKTSYIKTTFPIPWLDAGEIPYYQLKDGDVLVNICDQHDFSFEKALSFYLQKECARYLKDGRALRVLKNFAIKNNIIKALKYLETSELLQTLPLQRPDITRQLIPRGKELEILKYENEADYEVILDWVCKCVGNPYPVFAIMLKNPSNRELVVKGINYYIIDKHRGCAAYPNPEKRKFSLQTYVHEIFIDDVPEEKFIDYLAVDENVQKLIKRGNTFYEKKGKILPPIYHTLQPLLGIPAHSSGVFDLQLYRGYTHTCPMARHDILMGIEIVTNIGVVRIKEFALELF